MKETEETKKARARLEDITIELVKLKNKRYRTDIQEQNKEYRMLCLKIWSLEDEKERLLDFIKKQYEE